MRRPKPKKREDGKGYEHNGAKRKSGLNKSFADTGLGDLKAKIESKAKAGGREVALVAPQYTTIDCSRCGAEVKKALSTRTHRCSSCGLVLDRDENAARNILMKANFKGIYRTLVREVKPLKDCEMQSV
jgi:putative transposase